MCCVPVRKGYSASSAAMAAMKGAANTSAYVHPYIPRWDGPCRVMKVMCEEGVCLFEDLFAGQCSGPQKRSSPAEGLESGYVGRKVIKCDVPRNEPLTPQTALARLKDSLPTMSV